MLDGAVLVDLGRRGRAVADAHPDARAAAAADSDADLRQQDRPPRAPTTRVLREHRREARRPAVIADGIGARARHARTPSSRRSGRTTPRSGAAGRAARRERRGDPGGVRRGRAGVSVHRAPRSSSRRRLRGRSCIPSSSARRSRVPASSALTAGIAELLPAQRRRRRRPGRRAPSSRSSAAPRGEKIAYVRMFSGTIRTRDRLRFGRSTTRADKVTAISVFERGSAVARARRSPPARSASSGGSARSRSAIRIGETAPSAGERPSVRAADARVGRRRRARRDDRRALHVALAQLAEQDPLINLRQDDVQDELYVSLYGEVQKEVIQATLAGDFGLDVEFERDDADLHRAPARCRRCGRDRSAESDNPFLATVGFRIEPAADRHWFASDCRSMCVRSRSTSSRRSRSSANASRQTVRADARAGPPRLAGHGLERDADGLRLRVAGDHRRGLPQADSAGPDECAAELQAPRCASRSTTSDLEGPARRVAVGVSRPCAAARGSARRHRSRARRSRSKARSPRHGCTSCSGSCGR